MAASKATKQLARQLYKLSFVNGRLTEERVAGVLAYVEKNRPAQTVAVLKEYHRLIAAEVARNQAIVEHSGSVSPQTLQTIAASLTKKYQRPITATAQPNADLLAGLRVRVGDDVYEYSVAGQLQQLGAAV
jgi:F-type H+-transporting ATPase subunit delta